MSAKLKLISLNIEMDKHLKTVLPFLKAEQADVVCVQEIFEKEVRVFAETLGMAGHFEPVSVVDVSYVDGILGPDAELEKKGPQGIGFFTKLSIHKSGAEYYHGSPKEITKHSVDYSRFLLWREVEKDDALFTIGTTHFTWTPDGNTSDEQVEDVKKLFCILEKFSEIAFCGDFNAPRGREIWGDIAKRYKDNIPSEYKSSVDPVLHRAKQLEVMVDGLFTTPGYKASEVRLVEGVSDHKAIVALLEQVGH